MEQHVIPPNKFVKVGNVIYLETCRTGWKGIYDCLRSMITGKPICRFIKQFEVSLYARSNVECKMEISGIQLEIKN